MVRATRRILLAIGLALALLILGTPIRALAHDLPPDRLILWLEPSQGRLRAEVTLDPEHTREEYSDVPRAEIERRALAFVKSELRIEIDAKQLVVSSAFHAVWDPAKSMEGDIVDLRGSTPGPWHELRVSAGKQIKAIVISVHDEAALPAQNTLLKGGAASAPYVLGSAPLDAAWSRRTAEDLLTNIDAAPLPPSARGKVSSPGFASESRWALLKRYLALGFEHILPLGFDHLLFVAGLVLGSPRSPRRLVLWLSAFTLAHTLTLALGMFGVVGLPSAVVEPLIAVSIAYVGVENLLRKGAALAMRPALVFAFGLLHGLGFAQALRDVGLPPADRWLALLGFNAGVEAGQLSAVVLLVPLLLLLGDQDRVRRFAVVPGSFAIAGCGLVWAVARIAA